MYCLVLLLVLHTGLPAQEIKDTLFFKNASKVVGKLKKIKMGVVTFDPDDANDITVKLRKVSGVNASSEVFRVETISHIVAFGYLVPDSTAGYVRVVQPLSEVSMHLEDISQLYRFSNDVLQRFSGSMGFGYSYSKSSGFGKINFDGSLNYLSKKNEVKAALSGIYSQTDSGFTRDREEVNIKDNIYFSPTSFVTLILTYQKNLELGLDHRYQEGVGIGNKFVTSKSVYAWARGGIVFNQERNVEGVNSGFLSEAFAQLQFNLFKFTKPEVNLNMTQTIYAGLTDRGRIRNDGETNLDWEMVTDLRFNIGFYTNYDSKPPITGGSKFDYGLVLGIKYVF